MLILGVEKLVLTALFRKDECQVSKYGYEIDGEILLEHMKTH